MAVTGLGQLGAEGLVGRMAGVFGVNAAATDVHRE